MNEDPTASVAELTPATASDTAAPAPATTAAAAAIPEVVEETTKDQPAEVKQTVTTGGDMSTAQTPAAKAETKSDKRARLDLVKAPVRQYLDATVVPALLSGLSAVARERPANPIEFLGQYLVEKSKESTD